MSINIIVQFYWVLLLLGDNNPLVLFINVFEAKYKCDRLFEKVHVPKTIVVIARESYLSLL